ncbi:hypothetical protein FJ651_10660 [Paucihalobacter ruber]|uniref:Uncharacterized protein n=1 Tax=Paucihalobacter ruber TaxID=2567861 RepID=A0A506PGN4_9FLAO|nr:hypothetical protein [Paucihalobacter ruber]TPV32769.1 hypothetical protein FJ651_10660 [Paucihalobacter ruber]
MILAAKYLVVLFGVFLISVGFLMLFNPEKARAILRSAGSTNFINYTEITIRMIPAAALIIYANFSKYPESFKLLGWFMIATSLLLYLVPRSMHHKYSLYCANILKPNYVRMVAPFSMLFGGSLIYGVL